MALKNLPQSIIISRTDNLGDVVVTLPMAGYIKSIAPKTKVYFLGKSYTRSVIEASSFVDQFIDKDEVLQNPLMLREFNAGAIIFVLPDKAVAHAASKAAIPMRVGTSHKVYHWLYCNKRVSFSRRKSDLHEAQLNFKLFEPFEALTEPAFDQIKNWYGLDFGNESTNFSQWLVDDKFNLIVHPKSKGSAKEWGVENYADLVAQLPADDFNVLITGIKEEGDLLKTQVPQLFEHSHVQDLTGALSLDELMGLISKADGFLAGSTGPLHIASALGKFTLGIYPPIRPMHPGRWQPIGKNAHHITLNKECSDCRKSDTCACVKSITIAQVKSKLIEFTKYHNQSLNGK
ncbi:MAG TPA: glycosyl transferase family 9 [Microscillaceae bacterium]|nr:glycosyl transferase family 9 [Microscillaceae bacterium]